MVFAHGFGCDQSMWRHVAPAFEATHQVVLFDWVGAGSSDLSAFRPSRYASLTGYARDLLELIDELGLDDVVFVGHSVSAMIGVLAANHAPERFRSLVLVGPSPRYLDDTATAAASAPRTSTSCWPTWSGTSSAGRASWGRSSWATRIAPSWPAS
jgi:sigma-B regulation protein RsbQ